MSLSGLLADFLELGITPRQIFDPEWPIGERPVTYSARVTRDQKKDPKAPFLPADPVDVTIGDDLGWHLWEKDTRQCSSWFGGPAASVVQSVPKGGLVSTTEAAAVPQLLPLRQLEAGEPVSDDSYEQQPLELPDWAGWFPKDWLGLRSAGTEHLSQQTAWHPSFLGLVSVNKAGNPKVGTRVFDVDAESAVDRSVALQSLVSVQDFGSRVGEGFCGILGEGLALQLGKGGNLDGGPGHLPMVDWGKQEVGFGSSLVGGPFTTGGPGCVHSQNSDRDGNKLRPLHLSTGALFILEGGATGGDERPTTGTTTGTSSPATGTRERGGQSAGTSARTRSSESRDAPLAFERARWQKVRQGGPHWVRTSLRFDDSQSHQTPCGSFAGLWSWETPQAFYIPDGGQPRGNGLVLESEPGIPVGDPGGVITGGGGGGTGVITTGEGKPYGMGVNGGTPVVGGGGYRPAYVHSTNCVITSGGGVKASPTVTGSPNVGGALVLDEGLRDSWERWPIVVAWGGYGQGTGAVNGWTQSSGDALSYPAASGSLVFHPADVQLADVVNCTAQSDYTVSVVLPTGLGQMGFGCPHQATGGVATGFTITSNSSGDLLFQSMDSDGEVTATATLSHGSTSLGGGLGGSTGSTDNAVLRANGTGGSSVQAGSGVTLEDDDTFLNVDGVQLDPNSGVSTSMSGSYGIYCSDEGFGSSYKLQFSRPGPTTWQIPALDTSGASGDTVLALNASATAWELVTKASLAGALDDLSDVTITSATQYQVLQYNGSAWVEVSKLDMVNDPGSIGTSYPAHELEDDHSSSSQRDSIVLALRATANTYNFSQHGTSLAFYGAGGTYMGRVTGVRTGSSSGKIIIQPSTNNDTLEVIDASSQQRIVVGGTGIIALEDTITTGTYTPEGSTHLHIYAKNGQLAVVPAGGSEQILTGSGSVQADFQNSDAVNTAASGSGEVLVNDGAGGWDAQNLYTLPSGQDLTLQGSACLKLSATGCVEFGASGPSVKAGSGSPEGVATAPVGSLYVRTDGGGSTTLYVKESGTGNTGWVAK